MPTLRLPDGPTLAYDDTGGSGPALVFSHGLLMNRRMFAPQTAAFSGDYRCISWDARAHGETIASGPFDYWDSARDALALLDHLGIERAVFAGMSQGGFASLRVALLAPERVRALVLLDSQAGLEQPGADEVYLQIAETWRAEGLADDAATGIAYLILGADPAVWAPWISEWKRRPLDEMLVEASRTLLGREDLTERLPEITQPALVVHGEVDVAIPRERAEALAAGLPGAGGVVLVPGAAHAANLTHPEPVNQAIREFLGALPA
ncbi:MAG TPA: alpha/beta hydrolase [Mycobacteriales bacterium]|nr:alpha/beta hydrolase [Mycobacteriales bacterium]